MARRRTAEERDLAAQERTGAEPFPVTRTARDYVHTVHPDTGLDVVFKAGEALPEWVVLEPGQEAW